MEMIVVVLQCALAAVLAVAAAGKTMDLPGSRQAVRDFGVPAPWADRIGTALPAAEIALAVLILPGATARWAAITAGLLFFTFIAGVALNLMKGRRPDCHCFGIIHSERSGWPTIVRNAAFIAMAATIAWRGSPGPVAWLGALSEVAQIILLVGIAIVAIGGVQAWLLLQMRRQNSDLIELLGGLDRAALPAASDSAGNETPRLAPSFDLPTVSGDRMTLAGLLGGGKPVLLLFVDPGCGPCRQLVPDIREWTRRFADDITVALISRGTPEENREKFGDVPVALQEDIEIYTAYGANGTPSGVLVPPDGVIRDPGVTGQASIRELVVYALRRAGRATPEPKVAVLTDFSKEPSPSDMLRLPDSPDIGIEGTRLPLPTVDGGYVGLDDLAGEPVTLLFWRPDCPFCQSILPDLQEWEQVAESTGARLLIVSTGSEDDHRALGLRSRIVLDNAFTMGRDFRITGTPAALRLDASGRVMSPLVVGEDAVLDLLYEQVAIPELV